MIVRVAALGFVLAGLPASAQTPPSVLDCTSMFPKTADEAALVARFGRANVVTAELDGAEGSTERGTVLFPKDKARRIEIFWHDTAKSRRPASVRIRGSSGWVVRAPGQPGRTVGVATSLAGVEEANERPFMLNGFAWDMGGYGTDWKGGKLAGIEGGCTLSVRFDPDPKAKGRTLDRVSGEKQFGSSDAAIRAVKPVVSEISLGWPE